MSRSLLCPVPRASQEIGSRVATTSNGVRQAEHAGGCTLAPDTLPCCDAD